MRGVQRIRCGNTYIITYITNDPTRVIKWKKVMKRKRSRNNERIWQLNQKSSNDSRWLSRSDDIERYTLATPSVLLHCVLARKCLEAVVATWFVVQVSSNDVALHATSLQHLTTIKPVAHEHPFLISFYIVSIAKMGTEPVRDAWNGLTTVYITFNPVANMIGA